MLKCTKNAKKLSNIEKDFLVRFAHSAFYKIHISGAANRYAPVHMVFGLSDLYTNIQLDQKAKLDYHMSMLFAYMAGGEGVGLVVLKCFVRGGQNFFYLLCVCVGGGGGGEGQVQYLSFRKKKDHSGPVSLP